jgi:hypothetical protein
MNSGLMILLSTLTGGRRDGPADIDAMAEFEYVACCAEGGVGNGLNLFELNAESGGLGICREVEDMGGDWE